jgi:hypothetical protein
LHKFCKERRRSPRGCLEYDDTTDFIADCPKRKKLDTSPNKYNYTKQNDYSKVCTSRPSRYVSVINDNHLVSLMNFIATKVN